MKNIFIEIYVFQARIKSIISTKNDDVHWFLIKLYNRLLSINNNSKLTIHLKPKKCLVIYL